MRKCDTESEQMSGCVLGGLPVSVCDLFRILIFFSLCTIEKVDSFYKNAERFTQSRMAL